MQPKTVIKGPKQPKIRLNNGSLGIKHPILALNTQKYRYYDNPCPKIFQKTKI